MTYNQAKLLKLIDRVDMLSPCGECIYDGPILQHEKGWKFKCGCQHPEVKGSCNENWRCWHPIQKDSRGFKLAPRDAEWLIYFEPVESFRAKYEKVIHPECMTYEEKGYICPDDCENCSVKNTLCIVFSKAGKKKYQDWKKQQSVKQGKLLETSPVWVQPSLF